MVPAASPTNCRMFNFLGQVPSTSPRDQVPSCYFSRLGVSGNSCSKSNGTENFGKFVSKISVHLSRLSFFLEIWKFRKFPVPFGISTGYESARSFSREKLQDGERVFRVHTTLDAK